MQIPHETLQVTWNDNDTSFSIQLPWLNMEIDVDPQEKSWIKKATEYLLTNPSHPDVQRFLKELNDYTMSYEAPRSLDQFDAEKLQAVPELNIDFSTPQKLFGALKLRDLPFLEKHIPSAWTWNWEKILAKAHIEGTNLFDPVSFVSYLICYRLEWESTSWSGQDGLGQLLEKYLKKDEDTFFRMIGWITCQSWYVTMTSCDAMRPALEHFSKASDVIHHFIADEAGHYKFMEQVFEDIGKNKQDFEVGEGTKWLLDTHEKMALLSPLAFSAMINMFEAAYYEGKDPISRVIEMSSKPHASRGFDLHYKINQEHRHCDMPLHLAKRLMPQPKEHLQLTMSIFELTLHFLDTMEKNIEQTLGLTS